MAVTKLKGQDVAVYVGGAKIAGSTSCTVSYTSNTEDVSSKDDADAYFQHPEQTSLGWSVDNDSYVTSVAALSGLIGMWIARDKVLVEAKDGNGQVTLKGYAYMTSLEVTAQNGEYAEISLTLEGTGSDLI
ncbi:MAG: phage tail tube protein [Bacteroidales bacterium]|nr:phage tail tube protein [Bacteroidales bacterium]